MASSSLSIPAVDRISPLPDAVLCHILSFVPTKVSVATGLLSKRWKTLWKHVRVIDFDDGRFEDSFWRLVGQFILKLEKTASIQTMRISFSMSRNYIDPYHLQQLVKIAKSRKVENFYIIVKEGRMPKGRWRLWEPRGWIYGLFETLSFGTLVVLKLKKLEISKVTNVVSIPLLKTLYLEDVRFMEGFSDIENLLGGCLRLQDINLVDVTLVTDGICKEENFNGLPHLVRAKFSGRSEHLPFAWFSNAKYLHQDLLRSYVYGIPIFPNLTHMELVFDSNSWEHHKWKWIIQLLQNCPMLQKLTISEKYYMREILNEQPWEVPEIVPDCLSQLRTCCMRNFRGGAPDREFVKYIVGNSTRLETMTIRFSGRLDFSERYEMTKEFLFCYRSSTDCFINL